jgi:hypothetical protein
MHQETSQIHASTLFVVRHTGVQRVTHFSMFLHTHPCLFLAKTLCSNFVLKLCAQIFGEKYKDYSKTSSSRVSSPPSFSR